MSRNVHRSPSVHAEDPIDYNAPPFDVPAVFPYDVWLDSLGSDDPFPDEAPVLDPEPYDPSEEDLDWCLAEGGRG